MGLLDDIEKAQYRPPTACVFAEFIGGLNDQDKADVLTALDDRTFSSRAIFVACRLHGYTGGDSGIRRHRREECICH